MSREFSVRESLTVGDGWLFDVKREGVDFLAPPVVQMGGWSQRWTIDFDIYMRLFSKNISTDDIESLGHAVREPFQVLVNQTYDRRLELNISQEDVFEEPIHLVLFGTPTLMERVRALLLLTRDFEMIERIVPIEDEGYHVDITPIKSR